MSRGNNPIIAKDSTILVVAEALSHDIKRSIGTVNLQLKLARYKTESELKRDSPQATAMVSRFDRWTSAVNDLYDNADALKLAVRRGELLDPHQLIREMDTLLLSPAKLLIEEIGSLAGTLKPRSLAYDVLVGAHDALVRVHKTLAGLRDDLDENRDRNVDQLDLKKVIHAASDQLFELIGLHRADIIVSGEGTVLGNPEALLSVFINLIENSLKYRHPKRTPQIHITISGPSSTILELVRRRHGDSHLHQTFLQVVVSDNGLGIKDEEKNRVFEFGYRGESSASVPGTGYGLSRVRSVIEEHLGVCYFSDNTAAGVSAIIAIPGKSI